jgi:hypothetical protein
MGISCRFPLFFGLTKSLEYKANFVSYENDLFRTYGIKNA